MAATGTLNYILKVSNGNPKTLAALLLNNAAALQSALLSAGFQGVTVSQAQLQDLTQYPVGSPTPAPTALASNGGVIAGIVIACAVAITGIVLLIIFVPKRREIELPDRTGYERAPHNYVIET